MLELSHIIKEKIYENLDGEDLMNLHLAFGEDMDLRFYIDNKFPYSRLSVKMLGYMYDNFCSSRLLYYLDTAEESLWYEIFKGPQLSMSFLNEFTAKFTNGYWEYVSKYQRLSEEFMKSNIRKLNWMKILTNHKLSCDFLLSIIEKLNAYKNVIIETQKLCEVCIEKMCNRYNKSIMRDVCEYQKLSEKFIENNMYRVSLNEVLRYQKLSEEFLIRNELNFSKEDWTLISMYQELSEKFIIEYKTKLNMEKIIQIQKVSRNFLDVHSKLIDWESISCDPDLSFSFVCRMSAYVNWRKIWAYNKHLNELIDCYPRRVDWNMLSRNENITDRIASRYRDKIDWYLISKQRYGCSKFARKFSGSLMSSPFYQYGSSRLSSFWAEYRRLKETSKRAQARSDSEVAQARSDSEVAQARSDSEVAQARSDSEVGTSEEESYSVSNMEKLCDMIIEIYKNCKNVKIIREKQEMKRVVDHRKYEIMLQSNDIRGIPVSIRSSFIGYKYENGSFRALKMDDIELLSIDK